MGPGHIEGRVEGGWMHGKGPKHVSTRWYTSERIRTVVGGLGKALVCGYASVQVGACRRTWIHVGMGPGCIEGCVEGGWTHGKGPKCIGMLHGPCISAREWHEEEGDVSTLQ